MACDTYTVLMLHCNGADGSTSFPDASLSNHAMTANGNYQVDTAQSKFGGGSGLSLASGDYLSSADSDDWNFGTADFTIDFWLRYTSVGSDQVSFETGVPAADGLRINQRASATAAEVLIDGATKSFTLDSDYSNSTWYHLALVRAGTNMMLFRDGTQQGVTRASNENMTGGVTGISITASIGGTNPFAGWIDEFRISKGIARWTANFTPPTSEYCQGGSFLSRLALMGAG